MTETDRVRDTGVNGEREREEEGGVMLPGVEKRRRRAKNCQQLSSL